MKKITAPSILVFIGILFMGFNAIGQEILQNEFQNIPVQVGKKPVQKNTLLDYNTSILAAEEFRFHKEIKKARQDSGILEYRSNDNTILISKLDYLKLLRKTINQSDTEKEFFEAIGTYFDDNLIHILDLASVYDTTRGQTFYGYFDGLPRF